MELPQINSVWQNIKKGTNYIVWVNAYNNPDGYFVVYQTIPMPDRENTFIFGVRHTEDERPGACIWTPKVMGLIWDLKFTPKSNQEQEILAWARPLLNWHERFTLIGLRPNA